MAPTFLTVMPAEAGIQSGGSGGWSLRAPAFEGRRTRMRGPSVWLFHGALMKIANLTGERKAQRTVALLGGAYSFQEINSRRNG